MKILLDRRRFLALSAAGLSLTALPRLAAAEVPLPDAAKALGATVAAEGPSEKPLRLAVLSFQGSSFWEAADKGIAAATDYLKPLNTTVDYIQLGTGLTAETIVAGIDGALTKQYDGIATVPIFDGTVAKVNEAVAAGVPFVAFIADSAERSNRTVGMGQLAYDAGKTAGAFIAKQLGGKGKIAVITGYLGAAQHDARMNGALDYLKAEHPDITIVGPFECKDDDATAYSQATDAMTSNPDLSVIYVTAGGSEAAAKAVRDAGQTGKVGVVGYDDLPEKQQYKDGGEILALLDQAPGRQTFESLVMLHNILAFGKEYPADIPVAAPLALGKNAKP
ncbi:sugar ABC transporter substrate-binding protein [Prosthecomicrobium pneumaticum]|uniref:Ribose transport system substrate-binding protein n=1 Tax=Prosthecomicrobium pneumaticum TaxID=81895 RepID=A0A7W9CV85_9HYPH|nr:substrate-binding domain-containing protein [Prosthecomicrobium pneumaticum]MBB5752289.1 ribose transport system substrate-binding protein [Prosthecomicrobium pneumaticum]